METIEYGFTTRDFPSMAFSHQNLYVESDTANVFPVSYRLNVTLSNDACRYLVGSSDGDGGARRGPCCWLARRSPRDRRKRNLGRLRTA